MSSIAGTMLKVNPEVLKMNQMPKWNDLNLLSGLVRQLETGHIDGTPAGSINTREEFRSVLIDKVGPLLEIPKDHSYQATEYQLQTELRMLLKRVNEFLPAEMRMKVPDLAKDNRADRTKSQASELMTNLRGQFEKLFPTTGFKNLAEYKKAIEATGDKNLIEVFNLLDRGEFDLTIRRPENGRFWIPRVGFHNQFVTGSSKGYFTPSGRNHAEAGWTGFAYEKYVDLNAEAKPKYGSIRPLPQDSKSSPANSERFYGTDVFILKKEKVIDRLTFNLGDSNSLLAFNNRSGGSWESNVHEAKAWDQSFIPWSHRALLAPFLDRSKFGEPQSPIHSLLSQSWKMDESYFEIQIFGELNLDDVMAFEFQANPPSGEFLASLKRNGIEIRDGRSWPPKVWVEDVP